MTNVVYYELLKGSIYLLFLSPTLLIVVSIYSIWNIHNVSWGSRPDKKYDNNKKKSEVSRKIEIQYENYRSNFLILWTVINISIAKYIQYTYIENYDSAIFIFLILLIFLFVSQLFMTFISMVKNWYRSKLLGGTKSNYFEDVRATFNNCS